MTDVLSTATPGVKWLGGRESLPALLTLPETRLVFREHFSVQRFAVCRSFRLFRLFAPVFGICCLNDTQNDGRLRRSRACDLTDSDVHRRTMRGMQSSPTGSRHR